MADDTSAKTANPTPPAPADSTPRSPSQVAATGPAGGRIVPDVPGTPQAGTPATQKSLDDKLYLIRYRLDDRPHLAIVDQDKCRDYHDETKRPCAFFCPAHVYEWDETEKRTIVEYERCVECGACRIGCPYGNIDWKYPRGGFGVTWKYG